MIQKINSTLENIQKMGLSEAEYTQVFRLLNDSELALLEKMDNLNRLQEKELSLINVLVNKIMHMLATKFNKPAFAQILTAC
ncbi:MAG: hypothetical protein HQL70_04430 [Magnetococcales bacterium]|nr:hypothetical protein [Magnetococcales bacterium]